MPIGSSVYSPEDHCCYLLHGFASAPKYPSEKADVLERVFDLPVKQLDYDSAGSYADNLEHLKRQVDVPPLFFVGTSLGAFYASRLAEVFNDSAAMPIMLNPCHDPFRILSRLKGMNTNFVTGKNFDLTEQTIDSYRDIPFINTAVITPRWILLNLDDELIDAGETRKLYEDKLHIFTFEHGGHRFENITSDEVVGALEEINNSYFISGVAND